MRNMSGVSIFCFSALALAGCGSDPSPSPAQDVTPDESADAAEEAEGPEEETEEEPEPRDLHVDVCELLDETDLQNAFGPYSVTEESLAEETKNSGSVISACSWDITDNSELASVELSSYTRYTGTQDAGRLLEYRAAHEPGSKTQTGDRGFVLDSGSELFVVDDAFFEIDVESDIYDEDTRRTLLDELADLVVDNYSNED